MKAQALGDALYNANSQAASIANAAWVVAASAAAVAPMIVTISNKFHLFKKIKKNCVSFAVGRK